ncbi:uncharacterized protein LOC131860371 [Cryptomeria japonica]|uniref:uncharacterized protein LOC131860371 n=1 Tax=Cryptomeria japonica TaxID=3369 RepID=UPI0027DA8022|nr:uncharacterized protein LOC131860371 [Cryptomeria japonica]
MKEQQKETKTIRNVVYILSSLLPKTDTRNFATPINKLGQLVSKFREQMKSLEDEAYINVGNNYKKKRIENLMSEIDKGKVALTINKDYLKKALETRVVAVLLQKDNEGYEHPIAFYRKSLQEAELKYETMEKQAYALVKAVKTFRPYLVNAKITTYVPHAAVKDTLSQYEVIGKRCR